MRETTDGAFRLYNEDELFYDPLRWWSTTAPKYTLIDDLASIFVATPATSPPPERIWSRAARIHSLHRARLKDKLGSLMMFVRRMLKLCIGKAGNETAFASFDSA
jgi:hypothetical protein